MKDQLDFWLSKVTMYRLVTYCLSVLLLIAGALSLTGYFSFSVLSLVISVVVLLGATYGSSRLIGWLFSVRPHGESSIITSLILACLFLPPELSLLPLVKLALIGVFATATKYVLAIRGRHILNPAAAATVIASMLGVGFATWWIATPALLPVTLIIAVLILHKTRRLEMAMVFVAVAATLITIQSVMFGTTLLQGMWSAFASWPIIFFAGVMLSEPLTQPPRHWQQLTIAAGIAVLTMVPLHVAFVDMTPALALTIGNVVAWWWGTRRALKLKFVEKIQLTPTTYEFVFEGTVPFSAGQYLEFSLPHKHADSRGIRRVFTIATNPTDKKVRFGIKIYERPSSFKQALMKLEPGTIVPATRVAGDFLLPTNQKQPLLFVAGGIGITPLISFVRHLTATGEKRDMTLLYAVATADEIAYRDLLIKSGIKIILVTKGGKADVPQEWRVVDAPYVSQEILEKEVSDLKQRTVYVSGPPLMVNAVTRAAKKLGAKRIKTDHFTGY